MHSQPFSWKYHWWGEGWGLHILTYSGTQNLWEIFGPVPIKDMQTPPPSLLISLLWMMWSMLYSMVKIIKKILRFLFFEISWKINRKFTFFKTKLTITWKIKIGKIWFLFFLFRRFCIFHLNLTTFEIKIHKWSNLHGRSGIGWIERKNQISDFSDFYVLNYGHLSSFFF